MPANARNSKGIRSMNELFAMKKNQAFESKLTQRVSAMSRDFYGRRETLKQDIRSVYEDLQEIRLSTGYSLDNVRTTSSVQHAPKIYLPPIGLRLVQKYVGVDFKRPSPGKDDRGLNALSNALNLKRPAFPDPESLKLKSILKHVDGLTTERDNGQDPNAISRAGPADIKKNSIHKVDDYVINDNAISSSVPLYHNSVVMEAGKYDSQVKANKQSMNANALFQLTNKEPLEEPMSTRSKTPISDQQTRNEINLNMTFSHNPHDTTANTRESEQLSSDEEFGETNALYKDGDVNDSPETQGKVVIETSYNLVERRSSRSTFRTRNSVRMLSQSSALSERNLTFIERHKYSGKSSGQKSGRSRVSSKDNHSIESFYIDYGDGVLHDTNEIPRIKDCSRPWCNPHCKTCRNRATSRPCFVLVPKTSDVRKSKLPVDKRRASIFPRYAAVQSVKESSKETEKEEIKECSSPIDIETEQPMKNEKTFGSITNDNRDEAVHSVAEVNDDLDDTNGTANDDAPFEKEIQLLLMQRKAKAQKQGYSRKRLEELSQPRGGPPAEVRFSKMSLRKKQEQLKEHVRTKQLTQRERDHLTYIQGKISLFCALINEHELTGRSAPLIGISVSDGNSDGRVKSAGKRKAVLISTPRRD